MTAPTTDSTTTWRRPRLLITLGLALAGVIAIAAFLLTGVGGTPGDSNNGAMSSRADAVMPFDLAATIHTFTKTPDGGIEQVLVKYPADTVNTDAIRAHLAEEGEKFTAGDYSDPAEIHGAEMPGLAQLADGADRVQITYTEILGGARVTIRSSDPALISAVHAWFDAQNSDHAMPGMGG